jgi:hypothetical protein
MGRAFAKPITDGSFVFLTALESAGLRLSDPLMVGYGAIAGGERRRRLCGA